MIDATFWDPALGLAIEPILCFCLIKLEQFLPITLAIHIHIQVKSISGPLSPLSPMLLYSNSLPALPARPWVIAPPGGWERVVGIMGRWIGGGVHTFLSS